MPTPLPHSLSVGSGLMGSKDVEGLGRTELLSSNADDWSGCVSSPEGGLVGAVEGTSESSSPLLFDSDVEMLLSAKERGATVCQCFMDPTFSSATGQCPASVQIYIATTEHHLKCSLSNLANKIYRGY